MAICERGRMFVLPRGWGGLFWGSVGVWTLPNFALFAVKKYVLKIVQAGVIDLERCSDLGSVDVLKLPNCVARLSFSPGLIPH